MASIAVLPVLIGLAVDYAIQFQSRVQEEPGDARAERRAASARRRRADDRHRRCGDRRRLPRARAVAGADGPRLRDPARGRHRARRRVRADARRRGAGARCAPRRPGERRGRRAGALARARTAVEAAWNGAGEIVAGSAAWAAVGRGLHRAGDGALRGAIARPGRVLADRRGPRGRGLGARHADARGVRRPEARAAEPRARCTTCKRAAGHQRRRRRGRRARRGAPRHRPGGRRVDDALPGASCASCKFNAQRGCGRSDVCPAFSLPGPVHDEGLAGLASARRRRCSTPCRRTSRRA